MFTPPPSANGIFTIEYYVDDGYSASDTGEIDVNVIAVNSLPVFSFDSQQVQSVGGAGLSVMTLEAAFDADGDALTYKIVTLPKFGTLFQYVNGAMGPVVNSILRFAPRPGRHR